MNQSTSTKVVVITGGSEGLGKALCKLYITKGYKVATCARNEAKLNELAAECASSNLFTYIADVSNKQACSDFINSCVKQFNQIDILINNAGISMRGELLNTAVEVYERVMQVNIMGSIYCTKFALPYLAQTQGTVVAISSIAGYRGLPGRAGYSASKFALNGFIEAIKTELYTQKVHTVNVAPGYLQSNIRKDALLQNTNEQQGSSPLNEHQLMTAERCAEIVYYAVEKKKSRVVLTAQGKFTVFLNKWCPSLADKLTRKFFYKDNVLQR